MPHAALDISFHCNQKVLEAGKAATGLYAMSLSYCAATLSDGAVSGVWVKKEGKPAEVKKLVEVGLWVKEGNDYRIPDYLQHNFSKAHVEAKSKAGRESADKRWRPRKDMPNPMGDPLGDPMPRTLTHTHTHKSKAPLAEEGIEKDSLGIGEGAANGNGNAEVSEETRRAIRERFQLPPREA